MTTTKLLYDNTAAIYAHFSRKACNGKTRICGRNKTRYSSYRCYGGAKKRGCKNKEIRREYVDNYVLDELYEKLFSHYSIQKLTAMLNDYNNKIVTE